MATTEVLDSDGNSIPLHRCTISVVVVGAVTTITAAISGSSWVKVIDESVAGTTTATAWVKQ